MALILQDFFTFSPSAGRAGGSSADPEVRETAKSGRGLKVTFAASHAGMVNGNSVMYSPEGMYNSSHTWVWPQRKPIQAHHDDFSDPIGRIIGARYSAYSERDISEGQSDTLSFFNDIFKLTKDNVVELTKTLEDSKIFDQTDWRGVGELLLDGVISDSDAIEKILDGRYQGVSVTQRPRQAFCSICGTDWVKDSRCEHQRGEKDEDSGRIMYLVVGDTDYSEISYVNIPADKYAMNISAQSINDNSEIPVQSNKEVDDPDMLDRSTQTIMSFQLIDSLGKEIEMAVENKDSTNKDKLILEKQDIQDSTEKLQDNQNVQQENSESDNPVDLVEQDLSASDKEEPSPSDESLDTPDNTDPQVTIEEALKCLFEDRDNLTGLMCDLLFEAQEELIEEDARLSTKKRKSLPSSSFCGPGRSFPVPDCVRYTAAKKLIGRYKGEGNKSRILACVERKGKSLGCSTAGDNDNQDNLAKAEDVSIRDFSDDLLTDTLLSVEKEMVNRGLKAERKCDRCEELHTHITELEDSVPELQDTVKVLREEYKTVVGEHVMSEDAHKETLEKFQSSLQSFALTLLLLNDKETSEEELKARIEAMTLKDLEKITKETDLSKVISFVRSGLVQDPSEIITQDDAEPVEEHEADLTVKLSKSLVNFRNQHGTNYALSVMSDWMRSGKLPNDFTLDKAFELVAE